MDVSNRQDRFVAGLITPQHPASVLGSLNVRLKMADRFSGSARRDFSVPDCQAQLDQLRQKRADLYKGEHRQAFRYKLEVWFVDYEMERIQRLLDEQLRDRVL
jgi:hypothetical protein